MREEEQNLPHRNECNGLPKGRGPSGGGEKASVEDSSRGQFMGERREMMDDANEEGRRLEQGILRPA